MTWPRVKTGLWSLPADVTERLVETLESTLDAYCGAEVRLNPDGTIHDTDRQRIDAHIAQWGVRLGECPDLRIPYGDHTIPIVPLEEAMPESSDLSELIEHVKRRVPVFFDGKPYEIVSVEEREDRCVLTCVRYDGRETVVCRSNTCRLAIRLVDREYASRLDITLKPGWTFGLQRVANETSIFFRGADVVRTQDVQFNVPDGYVAGEVLGG